jgi:hypothetical protein
MHRSEPTVWLCRSLLIAAIASITAGCGGDDREAEQQLADDGPAMIERQAPAEPRPTTRAQQQQSEEFDVTPEFDGKLEQDGMGLETIINADSRSAYTESLRWISEDVSSTQYRNLERSLQYISVYDPRVMRNENRLLEVVDGMTGQEVIERAQELLREQRGG